MRRTRKPFLFVLVTGLCFSPLVWGQPRADNKKTAGPAGPAAAPVAVPSAPEASAVGAPPSGEAEPSKVKVERGVGGRKVYRITEEIRIEGKIQKPEAFFFYQKSSINYDWQELKQDFVPRILESVNQSPF